MTRTRDWRRHQRERIRRRRTHYNTVRWAHELGDGRRIDIATEHPACTCHQCRNRRGPSLQDRKAAVRDEIMTSRTRRATAEWRPEPAAA